ncbi:hypothetical protein AVEN_211527-1 [Araneus ventricosus]|uniref:Uncharacterized protein n=1 Tax=Araneus ventricosus TaxID=182803 RepID=A0A4Y2LKJ2_ARAVE|nr:hypothetical protein AVEN_211527-1 [Araneus ventricosus]
MDPQLMVHPNKFDGSVQATKWFRDFGLGNNAELIVKKGSKCIFGNLEEFVIGLPPLHINAGGELPRLGFHIRPTPVKWPEVHKMEMVGGFC